MNFYYLKYLATNINQIVSKKSLEVSGNLIQGVKDKFVVGQKGVLRLQTYVTADNGSVVKVNNDQNYVKNKLHSLVKWYEQITGLDEVRFMQNRVVEAQNRLVMAQENRREATKDLAVIQDKLKDIRSELDTTTKGEERYLHLITQEHAMLKEERNLNLKFQLCEKEERDCFAFLSSSVKESHEKERAQAEKTKYWSVIGSVIGTVIGIVGSSVNNEFKMRELRKLVLTSNDDRSEKAIKLYEMELMSLVNEMRSLSANNHSSQNSLVNEEMLLHNLNHSLPETSLVRLFEKQKQDMKNLAVVCISISVIVPVVAAIVQRLT